MKLSVLGTTMMSKITMLVIGLISAASPFIFLILYLFELFLGEK